ncbi:MULTISPECIES: agmatine deiminase family protein [unclassified Sphingomonas]|jgi:agmatine deiminase|uniref:agmatine deiminase family protein n=1 Tax=unclassified Sphingomonas TaxID=196159 RepID=UPI000832AB55|nr:MULTISPECIES: agmatine deiminase family protein [unclassified Sphingomonas]MCH4894569.1 agmatine deiminase [Sphingomonas sp. SFZ2018-12]
MTIAPPPEWAPHDAVWIGFPSHPELWLDDLEPARAEVAAFARAVHADGRGERVILVAADDEAADAAVRHAGDAASVVVEPFGDIWLRDTGPIVGANGRAHDFGFNGWGGKYDLPGDEDIGARLARRRRLPVIAHDWVLEGGAIDFDGTGRVVTTEQCLLNANRNPQLSQAAIEARLADELGLTRVLWLGAGLVNDHTDGHVDNLARFVAPGVLAIPDATENDPNWRVYQAAVERARGFADIEIVRLPSPGRVLDHEEEIIPASYMNFYIGNAAVVVPQYGQPNDAHAVEAIGALFPGRQALGLRADHILTGGGSFHCISQQVPKL